MSKPTNIEVNFTGHLTVTSLNGLTLLTIAKSNGIDISHYCGGVCSCGTCRVHIQSGISSLSKLSAREELVLGHSLSKENHRLACQARVIGNETVTVKVPQIY